MIVDKCRITGENLFPLWTFKKFPIHMGVSDDIDYYSDLEFKISYPSGVIQLSKLLPLDILYQKHHNSGAVGSLWEKHHSTFFEFIKQFNVNDVLEIGSGNCLLADMASNSIRWTIMEPNIQKIPNKNIKIINSFFDEKTIIRNKWKTIIHSHFIEHLYSPVDFIKKINNDMSIGSIHIFSIPNLSYWFKHGYLNTLNFEHTILLTEEIVDKILQENGHEILEKYYYDNHSIFYACKIIKKNNVNIPDMFNYEINTQIFKDTLINYIDYINNISEKRFYVFGAHVSTQYLLNMGLDQYEIISILDNSEYKHNKKLYGYDLSIYLPNTIKYMPNPVVLLQSGAYDNEIRKQLYDINNTTKII